MIGQSLVGAEAASDEAQRRGGQMIRMQKGSEVKVSSWDKAIPKRSRQEDCEGRTGMQKESKMVRCLLLNGSTWSTFFFFGTFDIFFGVVHRTKKVQQKKG